MMGGEKAGKRERRRAQEEEEDKLRIKREDGSVWMEWMTGKENLPSVRSSAKFLLAAYWKIGTVAKEKEE
jgi:hypothetical protein